MKKKKKSELIFVGYRMKQHHKDKVDTKASDLTKETGEIVSASCVVRKLIEEMK